jgi:ADP-heptose:LPS heptosyltransferase
MQKILVIKLGALGDFIQALGPMKAIRQHHKDAHITLLTTRPFQEFAEKSGYFDNILIDERPKFHQPLKWFSLRDTLNNGKFNRVYDLQNNDRTGFYFKLFSPKPDWVGVARGASHRNTSPERTQGLAFYGHRQTVGLAGVTDVSIDTLDWIEADLSAFNLPENYALIVPGCAPTRPEKRWPMESFIALCEKILQENITPVLIGTDSEKDITEKIKQTCPDVLDLTGRTSLFDIAPLARGARYAVGNDTGPMHMVAPTGCPCIVLFSGSSNPRRHAPLGDCVQTLQEDNIKDIDVESVCTAIERIPTLAPSKTASSAP